jgi:hypothetical protein
MAEKSKDSMIDVGDSMADLIDDEDTQSTKVPGSYQKSPKWLKLAAMAVLLAVYCGILALAIVQGRRQCSSVMLQCFVFVFSLIFASPPE